MNTGIKTKDFQKKIAEVEIKTVIQLHSKADNLDYENLIKILTSEPITKEIAIIVLKKILVNAKELTRDALQTLQLLINLGANFDLLEDGDGCTALMNACYKGSLELAKFIIKENPEQINKASKQQRNCLFYAINSPVARNNYELIYTLLKAGVNPNHRENLHGDSSLSLSVKNGYNQISALLLQFGADPNIIITGHKSLLHIACEYLNIELLNMLLKSNANYLIKNENGELPIDILLKILHNGVNITELEYNTCIAMLSLFDELNHPDVASESRKESISSQHYFDQEAGVLAEKPVQEAGENKLSIKDIRKELSLSKSKLDYDDICAASGNSTTEKKEIKITQTIKIGENEISPIPKTADKNEKIKVKDIISVPIATDFSSNEICMYYKINVTATDIDYNRDISLLLDMSSTIINDYEIIKSENKVLSHQSQVQHNTIIELHNNSIKLSEMVEYLKGDMSTNLESKKQIDERLSLYAQELKDKEDKLRQTEKKIEELLKLNYALSEHKSHLQNDLLEKVRFYLIINRIRRLSN